MEIILDNYLELTIEEVYDVITEPSDHGMNIWPSRFDNQMKVKFVNDMIKYFIEKEEYEKCATLQKISDELENRK